MQTSQTVMPSSIVLHTHSAYPVHFRLWRYTSEPVTLEFLVTDYVTHLQHHVAQIL